jgi:hypothetical protein
MEGFSKPVWYWFVVCRYSRQRAKLIASTGAAGGDFPDPVQGADCLLVMNNPFQLALTGKFFFVWALIGLVLVGPIGVLICFLIHFQDQVDAVSTIASPVGWVFFAAVDSALYKALWRSSRKNFWEKMMMPLPTTSSGEYEV